MYLWHHFLIYMKRLSFVIRSFHFGFPSLLWIFVLISSIKMVQRERGLWCANAIKMAQTHTRRRRKKTNAFNVLPSRFAILGLNPHLFRIVLTRFFFRYFSDNGHIFFSLLPQLHTVVFGWFYFKVISGQNIGILSISFRCIFSLMH